MILGLFICSFVLGSNGFSIDSGQTSSNSNNLEWKWTFYLEESGGRMVLVISDDPEGMLSDCYIYGDEALIKTAMESAPNVRLVRVNAQVLKSMSDFCNQAKMNFLTKGLKALAKKIWHFFGLDSIHFIYPGTKWCGAGNISDSYDDLGTEVEADSCCRTHDHCEDNIESHESNHGLENKALYTKSHCDCDEEFNQCMTEANTTASIIIGRLYFNLAQIECFRLDHPIVGCLRTVGHNHKRCQEYELDYTKPREWQFFDAKEFIPLTEEEDEENKIDDDDRMDVFDYMLLLDDK